MMFTIKYLEKIIGKLHRLNKGLFFGLMITTVWMAFRVVDNALGGSTTLPPLYENALVVGAALIITYLIDNGLYENAVAAMAQSIEHGGIWRIRKEGGIVTLILFGFLLGRFIFSGGATYFTGESAVLAQESGSDHFEQIENFNSKKDRALARITASQDAEIKAIREAAEKAALKAEADAEKLAKATMDAAIGQGSTTEQKAYSQKRWISPEYSAILKKAENKKLSILKAGTAESRQIRLGASAEIKSVKAKYADALYKEKNDPKWDNLKSQLDNNIGVETMLWNAQRYTFYLIDFILIIGSFCGSWLVAVYIVKSDTDIEAFFPKKSSVADIVIDAIGAAGAFVVVYLAQLPAWLKNAASQKMVNVADSVEDSSSKYIAAMQAYIVSQDPSIAALAAAAARERATARAMEKAASADAPKPTRKKPKPAPEPDEDDFYDPEADSLAKLNEMPEYFDTPVVEPSDYMEAPEEPTAPEQYSKRLLGRPDSEELTPTAKPNLADRSSKSGDLFRAHLSKAKAYLQDGKLDLAKGRLSSALEALPDDHLKAKRLARLSELKSILYDE